MRKILIVMAVAATAFAAASGKVALNKETVQIDAAGESFWLYYPVVKVNGQEQKPSDVELAGESAVLSYPSGGKIRLTAAADSVSYSFLTVPGGINDVKFHLVMPTSLGRKGAKWTIGSKSGDFPKAKGPVKLFQGNAGDFALEVGGKRFAMLFPETYSWTELQDLREWNWDAIGIVFITPFNDQKRVVVLPFGADKSGLERVRAKTEAAFFAKNGSGGGAAAPQKGAVPTLALRMGGGGVRLACGSMGEFELGHPKLRIGGEDRSAPIETKVEGNVCRMKFKSGGALTATLDGNRVRYSLESRPEDYGRPFQDMYIPVNFNQGGRWFTDSASGAFPLAKDKTKLFQGNTKVFAFSDPNNAKLALSFSAAPWMEVQDNREWGWAIFWTGYHLPDGLTDWTVEVSLDTDGFARKVLVDEFGQVPRAFPGKIKSAAELEADLKNEDAYYASLGFAKKLAAKGLRLDAYGGLAGFGAKLKFKKTGFFHCEKRTVKGRERWYLVDPEGNPFFHLGICGFGASDDYTDISGRQDAFAWLPPHDGPMGAAWKDRPGDWWNGRAVSFYKANVIRKYGAYDDDALAARFIDRVRAVGFNSIGAFSGWPRPAREKKFPYVGFVELGNPRWIPSIRGMFDPFDEKSVREVRGATKRMAANADDPLVIGYFLANEQGLEDISRAIPALDAGYAAKREFVKFLAGKYGTIRKFNAAWGASEADFKSLEPKGLAVTTKAAFADVNAFKEIFLEAYYSLIASSFRAVDKNHMLIGNRWQPGTANDEILCCVCGKYMDVVSVNYYAAGVDRAFVTRIYEWTGRKPQFWSEFYYTATKESNCGLSGLDLETQAKRGMAYRNYLEAAADLGFVTGIEWFTLIDQAATGRFFEGQNGERANTGLFNVLDRPYKDLFAEMLNAHLDLYPVWFGRAEPWTFDDPRYNGKGDATRTYSIGHPVGKMVIDGKQDGFPLRPPERVPASRLVLGRDAEGLEASFKGAWDKDNLYLLVTVSDATPMCNKERGEWLWNGDGIEIFLGAESPEKGGPMLFTDWQILVSGAKPNEFHAVRAARQPEIVSAVVPSADGKGYVIECAIPWRAIDYSPKENDTVLFDLAIDDAPAGAGRRAQLMWNGSQRNSSDRSNWGRLVLVP